MPQKVIWRCPNCETINKGDVCFMCGEKRPKHETDANNSLQNTSNGNNGKTTRKKSKSTSKKRNNVFINILLAVLLILLLFVLVCLCYLFFTSKSDNPEESMTIINPPIPNNDNLEIMNTNAQFIYKSALEYCTTCISNGNTVADGIYCAILEKKKTRFTYSGTFKDMKKYLNNEIGQDTIQYYCVAVKNGLPNVAFWSSEPLDDIAATITQDKIIEENLVIGIYPPYSKAERELKIIEEDVITSSETLAIEQKEFDTQIFEDKLLSAINSERSSIDVYSVKNNSELAKISQNVLIDIYNKTYKKGTSASYFGETFEYKTFYYEEAFDISSYANEKDAACELLAYEKENFSSKWLDEKFQYFAVSMSANSDGTYCIVFCLSGDKTITVKNEIYPRDITELDLTGKGLAIADIENILYMYNLETLKLDDNNIPRTDVFGKLPKLRVLWLDGNGITSLQFLGNCKNLEVLTLNHNQIYDLSPISKLTSLKELYLIGNDISDLSTINSLVNLEIVDFSQNNLSSQEIIKWTESMPNISENNV